MEFGNVYVSSQRKGAGIDIDGLDNPICFKIDRGSPLGNPYLMIGESDDERNRVCDMYEVYFKEKVENKDNKFLEPLRSMYLALSKGHDIVLLCWCKPKRCHGDTIKAFLDSKKPI